MDFVILNKVNVSLLSLKETKNEPGTYRRIEKFWNLVKNYP